MDLDFDDEFGGFSDFSIYAFDFKYEFDDDFNKKFDPKHK